MMTLPRGARRRPQPYFFDTPLDRLRRYVVAPRTWIPGELVTASMMNTIRDALLEVEAGTSGAPEGCSQTFRGLRLRTHPDADKAAAQVWLDHADEIVMNDGETVLDWNDLSANIAAAGINGLDTGSEAASTWYSIWVARNSSTLTKGLLLHRAKNYLQDAAQEGTPDTGLSLRYDSTYTRVAQSFQVTVAGPVPFVETLWAKVGSPTGYMYATIEADSAGRPSGTPLATSDVLDVSNLTAWTSTVWLQSIFRSPVTLATGTTYHLVFYSTVTLSTTNYLNWRALSTGVYASGKAQKYDGAAWSDFTGDASFRVYVTQNDTALTLPTGYDQYCQIGWVFNDSGSNFTTMLALDRSVRHYAVAVSSGTSTVPAMVSTATCHPPTPVLMTTSMVRGDTSGHDIYTSGTLTTNTGWSDYVSAQGVGYWQNPGNAVLVEFQRLYYKSQGAATFIYPLSFRW